MTTTLQVHSCSGGYGITDGQKWFYYSFITAKQAEAFLTYHTKLISVFENVEKIKARTMYDHPQAIFFYHPYDHWLNKAWKVWARIAWMGRGFRCKFCGHKCQELRYPDMKKPMCNKCYYDPRRYDKTGC